MAAAAEHRDAFTLAKDDVVGLRPGLDLEVLVSAQGRGLDGAAERGLGHRDRDLAVDIELVALEPGVGLDRDDDVEVSGRSALGACHAAPGDPEGLAVVDAGGDRQLEGGLLLDHAGAAAAAARAGDHLALAVAARARGLHGEEALAVDDLTLAVAGRAGLRLGAGCRPAAIALLTGVAPRDRHLALDAGDGLRERDDDAGLEVRAALGAAATPTASEVAEQVPEQVPEAAEDLVRALEAAKAGPRRPVVAVLVEELALAVVAEDLEGLGGLLEALLRLGVPRVAIRVVLHRQLAIGALDVRRDGASLDAQNLVIVALCGHSAREAKHPAGDCQPRFRAKIHRGGRLW